MDTTISWEIAKGIICACSSALLCCMLLFNNSSKRKLDVALMAMSVFVGFALIAYNNIYYQFNLGGSLQKIWAHQRIWYIAISATIILFSIIVYIRRNPFNVIVCVVIVSIIELFLLFIFVISPPMV